MKAILLGLIASMTLFIGATVTADASPYVVTLEEVGSTVVATGSGQIDFAGLGFDGGGPVNPGIAPANDIIWLGATDQSENFYFVATRYSGPLNFGTGDGAYATSGSGNLVGIDDGQFLMVPLGYKSDSPLGESMSVYSSATFVSLGATPGIYKWTWGTDADQSFTLEIGATPLPAALPLFAAGFGMIGLLTRRKKRNAAAAA
jgi:hypothetical protein